MDPLYQQRLSPAKSITKRATGARGERFIPRRDDEQHIRYELTPSTPEASESTYDKVLRYEALDLGAHAGPILHFTGEPTRHHDTHASEVFSRSPVSAATRQLLETPRRFVRKISRVPFKILEAPDIQDDFYLSLVDWSARNILAVALRHAVYMWSGTNNRVEKLCELPASQCISSVRWIERGTHLAVGSMRGSVALWDVAAKTCVRTYRNHNTRVGTMDWNGPVLSTGSRDRLIIHHDVRAPSPYVSQQAGHKQEVCGIQWAPEGRQLASGGNDNHLLVWDQRKEQPVHVFDGHCAAVKALSWSPHQRGLLVSGGGTADRTIRFWDVLTGQGVHTIASGSQVCNLAWSKNVNEVVSTHGYSQNQVALWSYPSLAPLASLSGHSMRVLYLALSPDGTTAVTGAGDQTLRFWNLFPPCDKTQSSRSLHTPHSREMEIR